MASVERPVCWSGRSDAGISQEVQSALATALSSQSLTPILKEELRCKIQLNRLLHGQEEITADFSEKSCSVRELEPTFSCFLHVCL